jgi:thermitase
MQKRYSAVIALCLLPHLSLWALAPTDPMFEYQWQFENDGNFNVNNVSVAKAGADMKMTLAWNSTQGDSSIIVAIIDSGCRWKHPEFLGRIWTNKKEIDSNGIDDDKNGYVDDVRGWNFYDNNPDISDKDAHGTFMASLIGANANNNIGIAGVDWHCKLMIIALGPSRDSINARKAIRYAVDNGARVVNMSFGFASQNGIIDAPSINASVQYGIDKGVVFVGGAGNDDLEYVNYPASIPGVITVGSTDPDDRLSHLTRMNGTGSNFGSRLDLVAPGNWVLGLDISKTDPYSVVGSGTSNSTAFVSGICALLLAQNPLLNAAQIRDILRNTADDQVGLPSEDTPGWDKYHGAGRVNAYRALTYQGGAIRFVKSVTHPNRIQIIPLTELNWQDQSFKADGTRLLLSQH